MHPIYNRAVGGLMSSDWISEFLNFGRKTVGEEAMSDRAELQPVWALIEKWHAIARLYGKPEPMRDATYVSCADELEAWTRAWDQAIDLDARQDTPWWNPEEIRKHILGVPSKEQKAVDIPSENKI